MADRRIGRRDSEGKIILAPQQTLSGGVPEGIEGTIGLSDGYYAILDLFLSDAKRDELVLELKSILKSNSKKKTE